MASESSFFKILFVSPISFTNISKQSFYIQFYLIENFIFIFKTFFSKKDLKTKTKNGVLWPSESLHFVVWYCFKHAYWTELIALDC